MRWRDVWVCLGLGSLSCGAKSPLREPWLDEDAAFLDRPPPLERCGNGIDDNVDGRIDEGCPVCLRVGSSPWQSHPGEPPRCFGRTFTVHGDRAMYDFATIPAVDAAGWLSVGAATVDFSAGSTLCGTPCSCLDGADFTYFQTTFSIPDGFRLDAFEVAMESVDDGTRVTVFNDRNPTGTTDPGAFAMFPSGTTVRLERLLVTGLNRVVLTHVDDCCSGRTLRGVRVRINSGNLEQCR